MNVKDALRGTIWAAELSEAEMDRAIRGTSERRFPKGAYICHRGDPLDYWTGIVSGLVKMSSISRSGKAITFAGIGDGGWFGEGSVLKNEARQYDLVALRDTHLMMMNRATFFWLFENSTGFNRFLVRQLNERLGQFIATTEYGRAMDPKTRVARNLAWVCNPVLSPRVDGIIRITQEEVGLLADVSRPIVNRSLQELEAEGLLRVEHGQIVVRDVDALGSYES